MKEFEIKKNRVFLMKRMGNISQLAGVKRYELMDGKAKGIEAVDFKTGTGFNFTVLPGRGMDIAWADYKGIPISYISKTGISSPAYYEGDGMSWLRNFFAGLLTTCGLSNVGGPCEDDEPIIGSQKYGLHGRITNIGADNVCVKEEWVGDEFLMSVSGRVREAMLHCENLTLKREITSTLGANSLRIKDIVENEGFMDRPLMILYHINIGYPILDEGTRLISNSRDIKPNDELSAKNINDYDKIGTPEYCAKENVYFHDLFSLVDGTTYIGLINDRLEMGVYIKFNKKQLPSLTQWKQLSEAEYVVGLEPANCLPIGRIAQRKMGTLETIKPGEKRQFELEIGVFTNSFQIEEFENMVKALG